MIGFKSFWSAAVTLAGIEVLHIGAEVNASYESLH